MNYLVIGGAGFIGSALSISLANDGHRVVIIDNMSRSDKPPEHENIKVIEKDAQLMQLHDYVSWCDVIYFLAGSVGVGYVVEQPYDTLINNITLATSIIPIAKQLNKYIIFTSSSEVYGEGPFNEDVTLSIGPLTNLRWGYASAKLTTEFLIASSGCRYKILRLFNITGPGQSSDKYGMVIPRFVSAALSEKDIIVYGDGSQRRSFCHISDAINMFKQIEKLEENNIFNVGNENNASIIEIAQLVLTLTRSPSKIKFDPHYIRNSGDMLNRIPDLSKLQKRLSLTGLKDIQTIVQDVINDQLKH